MKVPAIVVEQLAVIALRSVKGISPFEAWTPDGSSPLSQDALFGPGMLASEDFSTKGRKIRHSTNASVKKNGTK